VIYLELPRLEYIPVTRTVRLTISGRAFVVFFSCSSVGLAYVGILVLLCQYVVITAEVVVSELDSDMAQRYSSAISCSNRYGGRQATQILAHAVQRCGSRVASAGNAWQAWSALVMFLVFPYRLMNGWYLSPEAPFPSS
jgi:hypothetical protein